MTLRVVTYEKEYYSKCLNLYQSNSIYIYIYLNFKRCIRPLLLLLLLLLLGHIFIIVLFALSMPKLKIESLAILNL